MTYFSDIDDLIAAIAALRPNPILQVLIPAVSGIAGVVAGFFLSVAKGSADRKASRRDAVKDAIRQRRQAAIDVFSPEAKWISDHPGFMGAASDWGPHETARSEAPGLFLRTGLVTDEAVSREADRYLRTLDAAMHSYMRADAAGVPGSPVEEFKEVAPKLRDEVLSARSFAQTWVDEDRESAWLAGRLSSSRGRLVALSDRSEDGQRNFRNRHFR